MLQPEAFREALPAAGREQNLAGLRNGAGTALHRMLVLAMPASPAGEPPAVFAKESREVVDVHQDSLPAQARQAIRQSRDFVQEESLREKIP